MIEFTTEPLPKTGTGKIRKLILRERFWAGKEKGCKVSAILDVRLYLSRTLDRLRNET